MGPLNEVTVGLGFEPVFGTDVGKGLFGEFVNGVEDGKS